MTLPLYSCSNNQYQMPMMNNSSVVDNLGNISVPSCPVQQRPISPPWGQNLQKNVTMNILYKVQPLGLVPVTNTSLFPNGNHVGSIMLCTLTPVFGEQRDLAKHHNTRLHRVKAIRSRKKPAIWKSTLFSDLKQRKLKRLQRRPLLKAKKEEVYEKWEKRRIRRDFKRRQRWHKFVNDGESSTPSWMNTSTETLRAGSESPFQCPLWWCKKSTRRSRRDEYEEDKWSRLRKRQPSRLSCLSDKSRSPIILRSSPF